MHPRESELAALYATMARIRAFELRVARRFRERDVHGFVHSSIGQEAVAAGACAALEPQDVLTTTHRGHGHCIARGADPVAMFAELFGRETGLCRGKGGSMHIADPRLGILGANGIVGAGIPLAVGAALTQRVMRGQGIAVAFFGDGAVHCGAFHEGLTLAVARRLAVVFVCEDNGYAEFTATARWGGPSIVDRAAGYGVAAQSVDGSDVLAVRDVMASAAARARAGDGPGFVAARAPRLAGHYEGDAQAYRPPDELEALRSNDPLLRGRAALADDRLVERAEQAAAVEMDAAVEAALAAPYPDPAGVLEDVYA